MISAKTSLNRAALKGGAATFVLALLATPVAGLAQTAAPVKTVAAADAAEEEGAIVVTGSLIKNPNLISSSPVTVTTADTIQLKAANVAEEVLRDIPGIVPSIGSAVNNGNGGASYVDLRGLGSIRNIVLLDGQRVVPADFNGRVDLNNIPLALVERVDALTGAAVTTYGADAITGVVNFITKQDFSGVDFQSSYGLTELGDGERFRADLTVGGNFDDGKGNATLSLGYQTADPVFQGARDVSIDNYDSNTGGLGGSGTAVPSRFSGTRVQTGGVINTLAPFVQTGLTPNPAFNPANPISATNPEFVPLLAPVTGGVANGGLRQIDPATGFANTAFVPFNFNPFNIFQTPFRRYNIYAQAKYAISDAVEVYTRGIFSKNTVDTIIAPSGSFGSSVTIPLSNPFLPAGLRNQFCAFNVAPVVNGRRQNADGTFTDVSGQATYVPRFAPDQCDRAAVAGQSAVENVLNPDGTISQVTRATPGVNSTLNRRTVELGPRISSFTTTFFDYRAGARGKITDAIDWDVSASYGESENAQAISGFTLTSRLRQSINSTNAATCIDTSNNCVPINIFGPAGSISPAAVNFVNVASFTAITTTLTQVKGLVSGDSGVAVPFATDNIGFAVGAEYRRYFARQTADSIASSAGQLGGGGAATLPFSGGYDVKEIYGEIIAPIAQDKPFFENLTIEAGARYSAYDVQAGANSTSYDTFTWKAGANWLIGQGFKLRGNYAKAVRAPNLAELFQPPVVALTNLSVDPCAGAAPVANTLLRNVCIAQGAPASTIGSINQPTAAQANATISGSLAVRPERAETFTIGAVYQPTYVPGLALTVDYYNIRVNGAITQPLSGDIIGNCFNGLTAASPTSFACQQVRRNPITGALDGDPAITGGLLVPQSNLGRLSTRGLDVTINYSRDLGFAKLGVQANGTFTFSQKFQATPTSVNRECVGFYSANCSFTGSLQPFFQSQVRTTLSFTDFDASLVWRHTSGLIQEPLDQAVNPFFQGTIAGGTLAGRVVDFQKISSFDYFDLSARFHLLENLTLTMTVNNIGDRKPPLVGSTAGSTSFNSGNTYPSTFDALGRRYTMQLGLRF